MTSTYATFAAPDASSGAFKHPQTQAWCLSRLLLAWVVPLLRLGHRKQLDADDLWPLQHKHRAGVVAAPFRREVERSQSIVRAYFKLFGGRFVLTGLAFFIATAATLAGPLVLHHVVTELTVDTYDVQELMTWIVGLFATQVVQALMENYARFDSEVIAIQFTGALKNMIYDKTLRLSADARLDYFVGDITNLYTTDCQFLLMAASSVHQFWLLPLQIACVTVLLYRLLGLASFAGFGVIALAFFLNNFVSTKIYARYIDFMECKDDRMQAVTEAFRSISIVKFNAWEDKMLARIGEERARELKNIWGFLAYSGASVVLMWGLPVFISVVTFSVYSGVFHKQLTPAIVFTSIALFQLIQIPLRMISDMIAALVKAKVAHGRIVAFLDLPEVDTDSVRSIHHPDADSHIKQNVIVAFKYGTFGWDYDSPILRDVNLRIKTGEFVVVHGPAGCGKSSFCAALLGDMANIDGSLYVGGSVAYCSQQPWIQHMTVRDNILFGRPFDRKKYEKVLEACALTKDLQSLPAGDRTEIGERGVNLSGGQKARVALARACYSDAGVFILDAPLSAVDAIVQNEIFQKCLLGLLRNRTIILVTHNPEIIASEHVTRAVTINEHGELVETRAVETRPEYKSVVTPLAAKAYVKHSYDNEDDDSNEAAYKTSTADDLKYAQLMEISTGLTSPLRQNSVSYIDEKADNDMKDATETHWLIEDEDQNVGRVGGGVFLSYYRAIGGFPILFIILVSQVLWQAFEIASSFWLSDWTNDASATEDGMFSETFRIQVYAGLGLASALMVVVRALVVSWSGLGAAKRLFDRMTYSLMHAPMKFFDANPIGRILVRYANDVTDLDLSVPLGFGSFFACLFSVGCTMAVTAVIIQHNGLFLIPVVILYIVVASFYLTPAREIERVLKTMEAPVVSHLSETIEGGHVIRAFGQSHVDRFKLTNDHKLDSSNKVWFAQLCVSRWFALYIQLLGSVLVFGVAYSLVLLHASLSSAIIGLAFSYVLKASQTVGNIFQAWSTVETTMVSPERIQQYIDVEQEAPHKVPSVDPPASSEWPSSGAIGFENVSFRYKEGDRLVLQNLNFTIAGGEKIGIVGRSGAGKSSLTMALFRINELASGSVSIDGVDVGKIGLKTLREKLSIIPQNPVLLRGELRRYLDPFDEYSDDALWSALHRVGLSDRIANDEDKLYCMVEEDGENFSVGERQMLCMSRALLRESRIVIFDEATASIDRETEQKLQRVIREAFVGSTVLTIAHRLDAILDADRILVLDGGEVVSFATPLELVEKGSGHFYELMREGGYLD
ncbi:hypothetical protein Poli38472_007501 [Pythium oligandrum]|uniref:Uncharacterized protein n=1 Tax=Pythium oligandrum TaxID=41045 RepID=A0A8K1FNZ0_PYTOL|nr:hypothetical protein Poli38472_007501 [Pythium oligandrum]|eukprot:TMW67829.1 hypothetical protein Poli38472_007501 [Pythium oligandrum]